MVTRLLCPKIVSKFVHNLSNKRSFSSKFLQKFLAQKSMNSSWEPSAEVQKFAAWLKPLSMSFSEMVHPFLSMADLALEQLCSVMYLFDGPAFNIMDDTNKTVKIK